MKCDFKDLNHSLIEILISFLKVDPILSLAELVNHLWRKIEQAWLIL